MSKNIPQVLQQDIQGMVTWVGTQQEYLYFFRNVSVFTCRSFEIPLKRVIDTPKYTDKILIINHTYTYHLLG